MGKRIHLFLLALAIGVIQGAAQVTTVRGIVTTEEDLSLIHIFKERAGIVNLDLAFNMVHHTTVTLAISANA